jgi:hypothetical protein
MSKSQALDARYQQTNQSQKVAALREPNDSPIEARLREIDAEYLGCPSQALLNERLEILVEMMRVRSQ